MKKKILLSVIPCVIILGIVLTLVLVKPWKAKGSGSCTIIIDCKTVKKEEKESFVKNDTLSGILEDKYQATFSGTFMTSLVGYTPDTTTDPKACEYWAFYYKDDNVTVLKAADDTLNEDEKKIMDFINGKIANYENVVEDDLAEFSSKAKKSLVNKGYIKITNEFIYSSVGVKEAPLKNKRVYKFVIETYDSTLWS